MTKINLPTELQSLVMMI